MPRMHSSTKLMIDNPPKGYVFIVPESRAKLSILNYLLSSKIVKFFYHKAKPLINSFNIHKNLYSTKIPEDVDLVISSFPINISKPYIIEILDHPALLAGYDYNLFMKSLKEIEHGILSENCKKIIVVNESSLKIMKKLFSRQVIKKVELVRATINRQDFKKNFDKKKLQVIFIGSIANPDDFYLKGGLEAMESFKRIADDFNVEMIVRCKVPEEIKEKYSGIKNLKIIDSAMPYEEWQNLLKNSDICLMPGHTYALMATLECMSYGIPIISVVNYAVKDYLSSKYALLIKHSSKIGEYKSKEYPLNVRTKKFISEIKNLDEKLISRISSSLEKLIKNKKLREKLGREAKRTAEAKFSIETRNNKLKKIFDEALS